jgi:alpha-galactosidase
MHKVRSILMAAPLAWVGSTAPPAATLSNGLALTPPMGWNDWNAFGCDVSAQPVEQTAVWTETGAIHAADWVMALASTIGCRPSGYRALMSGESP